MFAFTLSSSGARRGYGLKSNLSENFDPHIGVRSRKPKKPLVQLDPFNPSVSDPISPRLPATDTFLSIASLHLSDNNSISTFSDLHPTNPISANPNPDITNITTSAMVVGSFPPLTSVREIREFDGSAEKLTDFFASVEGHLAAYNLPLKTGGIVQSDVDEG